MLCLLIGIASPRRFWLHLTYHYYIDKKGFPDLSPLPSWPSTMFNPHWLKLPMPRTNFHSPDIRAIEVLLYKCRLYCINIYEQSENAQQLQKTPTYFSVSSLLRRDTACITIVHVSPATTQISCRRSLYPLEEPSDLCYPQSSLRRFWPDCADTQAAGWFESSLVALAILQEMLWPG